MSSINQKRIKGLRRYSQNDSSFSAMIPFGTDGDLIDTFSGLDLEEELLIGGKKTISFDENQDELIIIEKYYDKENECRYSKITNLTSASTYQIINADDEEGENSALGYTEEDPYQTVLIGDFLGKLQLEIKVQLYKGDIDEDGVLLHTKNISLNEGVFEETLDVTEDQDNEEEEEEEP